MGGHLALRAIVERRIEASALVLVAPMLGLLPDWAPARLLHPIARGVRALGDPRRPAWKRNEAPGTGVKSRIELLTHDEARYAEEGWWREQRPDLRMGPASWGWIAAALASIRLLQRRGVLERVDIPVLILGTSTDRLVSWRAIREAATRLPQVELVAFGPEARHEILREEPSVRERALSTIAGFLDRSAPPA
jgi:lysophospholipase